MICKQLRQLLKTRLTLSLQLRTTCALKKKKASYPNYIHVESSCGVAKEERRYIITSLHHNLIASECVHVTVCVQPQGLSFKLSVLG